ncbi:MAG TPA: hypothetical protein VM266_09435 [Solirubrobacteraceae bacterium]|nr:hypothetical protein [Solirubrobacteraceae bacterium]
MADLERDLRELRVEWPATPDLAAAVRGRLPARPPRRSWRPALVRAGVALLVLLGGALAVPPARSAILELLGLDGVRIERRQPQAPPPPASPPPLGAGLGLGRAVTPEEAAGRAGFAAAPPRGLGRPDATYFAPDPPGGMVSYVYRPRPGLPRARETGAGLVVTQFEATVSPVIAKTAGSGTGVERITVDGQPGYWLAGAPHGFTFLDREGSPRSAGRLAARTLLLERDRVLVRLEGDMSRRRAIAIARTIRAGSR